eukprot:RCo012851
MHGYGGEVEIPVPPTARKSTPSAASDSGDIPNPAVPLTKVSFVEIPGARGGYASSCTDSPTTSSQGGARAQLPSGALVYGHAFDVSKACENLQKTLQDVQKKSARTFDLSVSAAEPWDTVLRRLQVAVAAAAPGAEALV